MSKRIFYSTTLVLIAALVLSGTALAAPSATAIHQVNRVGRIMAIGSSNFTIQKIGGQTISVKVSDTTQYQRVSGGNLSFNNLGTGIWVTAIGTFDHEHVLNATTVVVMPANLNRGRWLGKRAYGSVLQVIPGSQTFTVLTKNGRMTFSVDDSTQFSGNSVRYFGALQAGMNVVVGYKRQSDGTLYARVVGAY